ncbi:MAG: Crp/Fnr family transcriptional regulator [Proteobacteria bacterium]|nr:Crp/Fnr family transcriptional regulator [Pseudomonadota bacterium]
MSDSGTWTLAGVTMLADLPQDRVRALETKCVWRRFDKDAVIVDRNNQSTEMYFLVSGSARVVHNVESGEKAGTITFATLANGVMFGEIAALDGKGRTAAVVGNEECVVASLSAQDFRELLRDHGFIALRLLERFASIIRLLDNRVTDLSLLGPDQRIYNELMRLARPATNVDGIWVIDDLPNHQEIASWANTTRETVAYAIGNLARRGIVERRHKTLYIRDPKMLQNLSR